MKSKWLMMNNRQKCQHLEGLGLTIKKIRKLNIHA